MSKTKTACAQCGTAFACGAVDTNAPCWCQSYPAVLPLTDKKACLCANCLKQCLVDGLPAYLQSIEHDKALVLASNYSAENDLEEGIDYQMENGLMTFSAWYHLKRGYCCDNGCRHCPYPKNKT